MVKRIVVSLLIGTAMLGGLTSVSRAGLDCAPRDQKFVSCTATEDPPADADETPASDSDEGPDPTPEDTEETYRPAAPPNEELPRNCRRANNLVICRPISTDAPAPPAEAPPGPAVTISDLQEYLPTAPAVRMQPSTWMLRGAPTNFIVDARTTTATATLLGRASDVRFTPVSYTYDYGDGSTATVGEPGTSWEDLQLPEFSETPTSHVYTERATRTITISTNYTAEFRFENQPWQPINGTVATTTTTTGRTVTIDTVLVPGRCIHNTEDPNCRIR